MLKAHQDLLILALAIAASNLPVVSAAGKFINHDQDKCTKINEQGEEVFCKSGLTRGQVAGIAVGSTAFIVLLIFAGTYLWYRRKGATESAKSGPHDEFAHKSKSEGDDQAEPMLKGSHWRRPGGT